MHVWRALTSCPLECTLLGVRQLGESATRMHTTASNRKADTVVIRRLRKVRVNARLAQISALAILLAGQFALAQGASTIYGRVTDSSSAPIFGAVVVIQGRDGKSYTTVTD